MRALVTGGAGFIGRNVVDRLLQLGHDVTVLDDVSSGYRDNVRPDTRLVEGDVTDPRTVADAIEGCEVVLHLAASVGNARSIADPLTDSRTNVIGTLTVLEAARTRGVGRIVFSSSAGVFGELKTLPIAEDHAQNPDSPYGASKLAAEKMCLVYNKLYGMQNVCLRYFNVYGRFQRYDAYGNVIPIFADWLTGSLHLTIFGDGEQTRDFVNVSDVATANVVAATSPGATGVFNLGSGNRVSINHLARLMIEVWDSSVGVEYVALRPGDVRDSLADISAAGKAFGFEPSVGLRDGLAEYREWLENDQVSAQRRAVQS